MVTCPERIGPHLPCSIFKRVRSDQKCSTSTMSLLNLPHPIFPGEAVSKSVYAALWVIIYFPPYNRFRKPHAISMKNVLTSNCLVAPVQTFTDTIYTGADHSHFLEYSTGKKNVLFGQSLFKGPLKYTPERMLTRTTVLIYSSLGLTIIYSIYSHNLKCLRP